MCITGGFHEAAKDYPVNQANVGFSFWFLKKAHHGIKKTKIERSQLRFDKY